MGRVFALFMFVGVVLAGEPVIQYQGLPWGSTQTEVESYLTGCRVDETLYRKSSSEWVWASYDRMVSTSLWFDSDGLLESVVVTYRGFDLERRHGAIMAVNTDVFGSPFEGTAPGFPPVFMWRDGSGGSFRLSWDGESLVTSLRGPRLPGAEVGE